MPFEGLSNRTCQALQDLMAEVRELAPVQTRCWEFEVAPYQEHGVHPGIVGDVTDWANEGYSLYYLELIGQPNLDAVAQAFAMAKAQGVDERSFSRLNNPSNTLYVGGSGSIATRLRQHLGYGARRTYSLHLAHWAPPLQLSFRLCCAEYAQDENVDVFQALEDQLWDELAPMFGRKGRR